ncbi:MAG: hypothetical protein DI569_15090 [Sphingopyxis macrogoltabida]|uniref:Uncharacterized protein n=1 Tax=Sphingopyxis macrogoltabida TaxID=33050 RepID=A0A2W5MKZ6_SPHMC|nr:MAG: hypothetical protein DI569_15090 [Sphingopyxis macrogoltabida]
MTDRNVETDWREFVCANLESHVVAGRAIGNGGKGAYYTLANGRVFRLSAEDCRLAGPPDWGLDIPS